MSKDTFELDRTRVFKAIGVWLPTDITTLANAIEKAIQKASLPSPDYQRGQEEMRERAAKTVYAAVHRDGSPDGCDCPQCCTLRSLECDIRALPAQQESECEPCRACDTPLADCPGWVPGLSEAEQPCKQQESVCEWVRDEDIPIL